MSLFVLPAPPVVYLIFFHISFILFVWSYWKTIFTQPANPSKEVQQPNSPKTSRLGISTIPSLTLKIRFFFFLLPPCAAVLPAQS